MPDPALLHEIFLRVAERHPGRIALDVPPAEPGGERITVTYGALRTHAAALAASVAPHAGPEDVVAVLLARNDPRLYAAQLGILQAGAAFTCLDPAFPDAHIAEVVADAAAVVCDAASRERLHGLGLSLPPLLAAGAADAAANDLSALHQPSPSSLAYVIYTSGTTGKPKGVMVEHRAIVNLVLADLDYFHLQPDTRVAQCSSPAYDSSLEETWLALAAGATLVLLDDATIRLGPDLPAWLRRERINVLCPPPTLLRAMGCQHPERELPDLHLLYVGGEALPQELADRWSRGRWMENGYGPTECTVTSVRTRVHPGKPVTIGGPVAHCTAFVLREDGGEAPPGEAGELCLGGACLARGYRHLPELTAAKFIEHPRFGRLYRTGDLARCSNDGELECLGRIDAQVKLRGYRIELEAIEAVLARCSGVRAAACTLQGEAIAAFWVPEDPAAPPALPQLRQTVAASLPVYMVPSRFAFLPALPTTVGGKLDRAQLPQATLAAGESKPIAPPRNPAERAAAAAFAAALRQPDGVDLHDDFFLDQPGDSLSAVGCIVRLRAEGWSVTVRDLYQARTIAALAPLMTRTELEARQESTREPASKTADPGSGLSVRSRSAVAHRFSGRGETQAEQGGGSEREGAYTNVRDRARTTTTQRGAADRPAPIHSVWPVWCTSLQAAWIAAEIVLVSALGYWAAFVALPWLLERGPLWMGLLLAGIASTLAALFYAPLSVLLTAALKKLLIGRYRPLRTPVWSSFYLRHWIVVQTARNIPWGLLQGTSAQSWALRRLGARVGRGVYIHRGVDLARGGWDLLSLGDGVTLGQEVALGLTGLDDGELEIGPITLGRDATLDTRTGIDPGASLGDRASLGPLSWLPTGCRVPAGEHWEGTPAARVGIAVEAPAIRGAALPASAHAALMLSGRAAGAFASVLPLVILTALLPAPLATRLTDWIYAPRFDAPMIAAAAALVALALVLSLLVRALAARWLGRLPSGPVSLWSLTAIRLHTTGRLLEESGRWLAGTLFWPLWLRAAGMRVGRRCEISTILDVVPAAVSLADECFFADGIYLAGPRRHRGTLTIPRSRFGERTFIGNHAVIPAGHVWPDDMFIGVATVPDSAQVRPHTAWFGQPPMELPRRATLVDRRFSYTPGPLRYATRLFWELARFALPVLPLLLLAAWAAGVYAVNGSAWWLAFAISPALLAATMLAAMAAVCAAKWGLLGKVKPGQRNFWSCWCGRWDILYMAWEYWGQPVLAPLEGTLLLNMFLRRMGVHLGRRVALGPGFAQVVDPDMLHFADGATVNGHMQSHTFEDRLLKMDSIRVGPAATVGDDSIVLYGAHIGPGARLEPHAVLMKHDAVPAAARFLGAPARPATDRSLVSVTAGGTEM